MKFDVFGIMKAVKDAMSDKEFARRCRERIRAPIEGFNVMKNARAVYDLGKCRFTRVDVNLEEFEDFAEMLGELTKAINDALDQADAAWEEMSPGSLKRLGAESAAPREMEKLGAEAADMLEAEKPA